MSNNTKKQIDDQFQTLLETVERIRKDKFSHLDNDLVRDLLRLHADRSTVDADLTREVERNVEQHLSRGI